MPKRQEQSSLYFQYGDDDIAFLKKHDSRLGAVIDSVGPIQRRIWPDPFTGLMRAIMGQQVSSPAQKTVWSKFCATFSPLEPRLIAEASLESLRLCGMSGRKAEYLKGIAQGFASGEIDSSHWASMGNGELTVEISKLRGVGKWTVEMLLIFTFQRPDVLSYDDLAIRRGMSLLYGHKKLSYDTFMDHYRCYGPAATLAGMYLWEVAGGMGR